MQKHKTFIALFGVLGIITLAPLALFTNYVIEKIPYLPMVAALLFAAALYFYDWQKALMANIPFDRWSVFRRAISLLALSSYLLISHLIFKYDLPRDYIAYIPFVIVAVALGIEAKSQNWQRR